MKNTGSEYSTMVGNFSAAKGDLRLLNVSAGIGGKSYLSYQKVPSRTKEFCQWLNAERKRIDPLDIKRIYDLSFEAHYRLVGIHPWVDGNGRMSRLVMNMIQFEFGVVPSIVKKERRKEYIESLEKSQEQECSERFVAFMLNHHCRNLMKQIDEFKRSMGDEGGEKQKNTQKTTQKQRQKTTQKTTQKIISEIRKNSTVTRLQLAERCGISPDGIKWQLRKLQQQGVIRRVGSDRGGHWEIVGEK